jgi:hypothetical protein
MVACDNTDTPIGVITEFHRPRKFGKGREYNETIDPAIHNFWLRLINNQFLIKDCDNTSRKRVKPVLAQCARRVIKMRYGRGYCRNVTSRLPQRELLSWITGFRLRRYLNKVLLEVCIRYKNQNLSQSRDSIRKPACLIYVK